MQWIFTNDTLFSFYSNMSCLFSWIVLFTESMAARWPHFTWTPCWVSFKWTDLFKSYWGEAIVDTCTWYTNLPFLYTITNRTWSESDTLTTVVCISSFHCILYVQIYVNITWLLRLRCPERGMHFFFLSSRRFLWTWFQPYFIPKEASSHSFKF